MARADRRRVRPLRRKTDIEWVELEGEIVIYDERTDGIHHLNATATILWKICDGTATEDELVTDISEAFGVDRVQVAKQVRSAIDEMAAAGLMDAPARRRGEVS